MVSMEARFQGHLFVLERWAVDDEDEETSDDESEGSAFLIFALVEVMLQDLRASSRITKHDTPRPVCISGHVHLFSFFGAYSY